jgi:hypothetical protein
MKCEICGREASGDLCVYHERAREHLESAYASWARAYGGITRRAYLDRVITNAQTGQWAKEVAQLLAGRLDDKKNT